VVYENKVIDPIPINWVLSINLQCVPFVCVAHYGDQNIAPYIVSILPDPCHQTSSYQSLEYGGSLIQYYIM